MQKRRKNVVQTEMIPSECEPTALSLTDAKSLFLHDIKDLSRETQRWHRENLTAFERVLAKQNIAVEDVTQLTPTFIRHKFAFYMLEDALIVCLMGIYRGWTFSSLSESSSFYV